MRFRTTIVQIGNNTGIELSQEILAELGGGKRPPVKVTVNGFSYRTTPGSMNGRTMVPLSKERREAAGVLGGQEVEVEIVLDTEPRVIELPEDLAAALAAEPLALATYEKLSNSNKGWHVLQVTGAKTDATRQRRIENAVATLKAGKSR